MREYELTVLLRPTFSDKEIDKEVAKVTAFITKSGGKVKTNKDAKKRALSYAILKQKEAYEAYFEIELDPSKARVVETDLKLTDSVIRYLLIKKE